MEETWRWFGPDDPTRLAHIRQTGARGIVTSLHHVKYGEVWSVDEIQRRIAEMPAATGVHRGDQLDARRVGDVGIGAGHADLAGL